MGRICHWSRSPLALCIALMGSLLVLRHGALSVPVVSAKAVKPKRSVRLRGYRHQATATTLPPINQQQKAVHRTSSSTTTSTQKQTQTTPNRNLESMWENTETAHHIEFGYQRNPEPEEPAEEPEEKVIVDVIVDGELLSDSDLAPVREEEEPTGTEEPPSLDTDAIDEEKPSLEEDEVDPYEVEPMKEEPKELYVHHGGKKGKAKSAHKNPSEEEPEPEELEEGDEEAEEEEDFPVEPAASPGLPVMDEKEEEEEDEQPLERPKDLKDDRDEYVSAEAAHREPESEDEEDEAEKQSGKGKGKGRSRTPRKAQIAEIGVGIHYTRLSKKAPTNQDFSAVARITSHVCDYIFRTYFEDMEEALFLSTDQLAIYNVVANDYVEYTVAAYFDGGSSILPEESRLTDIVVRSLQKDTTYYDYYLFLLENLGPGNAFAGVQSIEINLQSSHLTGPAGHLNPPNNNSNITQRGTSRIFKVIIPIVVVMLISVVAAMVYMNWVESHELPEEEGEILNKISRRQDPRKRLHQNRRYRHRQYHSAHSSDGEHSTLPSEGDQSSYSCADDATSVSESSDRFVEDMEPPPPRRAKQVRVSPRIRYRTFTPADFSTRVDFEEVNLHDDDDDDDDDDCPIPLEPPIQPNKTSGNDVVLMSQLMDDFARVLNSAPLQIADSQSEGPPMRNKEGARNDQALSIPWDEISKAGSEVTSDSPSISRTRSADPDGIEPVDDVNAEKSRRVSEATVATSNANPAQPTSIKKPAPERIPETASVPDVSTKKTPPQAMMATLRDMNRELDENMSKLAALRNMNRELDENMSKFRSAVTRSVGESTDMEDEFEEEEVVEEEVTVMTEYEEEEVGEEETFYEETVCDTVTAYDSKEKGENVVIEDSNEGEAAQAQPEETTTAASPTDSETPEVIQDAPSTDDASVTSQVSNSKLPPKKLRDFWEKKSMDQQNPRDFWEHKSRKKP